MKIKFSHFYEKMPRDYRLSRLTQIEVVDLEDLDPTFIERDTAIQGGGHYPLPKKGKYMILYLESSIMNIRWQTIRRWTYKKQIFYFMNIGKLVECEVTG